MRKFTLKKLRTSHNLRMEFVLDMLRPSLLTHKEVEDGWTVEIHTNGKTGEALRIVDISELKVKGNGGCEGNSWLRHDSPEANALILSAESIYLEALNGSFAEVKNIIDKIYLRRDITDTSPPSQRKTAATVYRS